MDRKISKAPAEPRDRQKLLNARLNVESKLDQRLFEMKATIMGMVDYSLDEKILSGREVVLAALEKLSFDFSRS